MSGGDFSALPVLQTLFRPDGVERLIGTAYGLSDVRCQLVKNTMRTVYEVVSSEGKRIFAIYGHDRPYNEIQAEVAVVNTLAAFGFSTPAVQPTLDGSFFVEIDAPEGLRRATLSEFAGGRVLERQPAAEIARRVGALLAEFHIAAAHLPPVSRPEIGWDKLIDQALAAFADAAPEQRVHIASLHAWAERLGPMFDAFPRDAGVFSLIHGDAIPSNVLVRQHGLTLIDFDQCGYGWCVFDLATLLYEAEYWGMSADAKSAFVDGYSAARALADAEWQMLPVLMAAYGIYALGVPAAKINQWGRAYFSPAIIERQMGIIAGLMQRLE